MAQFDIHENADPRSRERTPYLIDLQTEILSELAAIPVSLLGPPLASARSERTAITGATDLLLTGF